MNNKKTKPCSKCGKRIPKERAAGYCKKCMAEYTNDRYHDPESGLRDYHKEYYEAHKDVILERSRAWNKANGNAYYQKNKKKIQAQKRARWAQRNAELNKGP